MTTPFHAFIHIAVVLFSFFTSWIFTPLSPTYSPSFRTFSQTSDFTRTSCMFELPARAVEGEDVLCGYLTVPLEHAHPNGATIQLAVAIIKSREPNPKPDPLFMAQGGPGGSTIDAYADRLLSGSRLRRDRDIVLFDQRGTLHSKPFLKCTEIDQLVLDTLDKDLTIEESNQLELEATTACSVRLKQEGINLSDFDSLENAADIESLRLALGYEKINLYGVSYGTLLALHYMRFYPNGLRSVILDGVVPPQTNFIIQTAQSTQRAFSKFFSACAQDPECNQAYPDLENVYWALISKLNQEPAIIPMTDPDTQKVYQVLIDGDSFHSGFFQMLYASSLIPALPRMIYDASAGKFDFFARIMPILIFDRTMSYGLFYSVLCAEDADFRPEDQDLSGVSPQIVALEKDSPMVFLRICENWKVEPLNPEVDKPVTSDIPTLILNGELDPITPPENGLAVAATLSRSYVYTFPAGSHGQALENECSDGIILAFLDNPDRAPDASCITKYSKPIFYTKANVIDFPVVNQLLKLEGSSWLELLLLILSLFLLLTALFIYPIVWLSRLLSGTPNQPSGIKSTFLSKLASWVACLNSLILLTFLVVLAVTLFNMVANNDNRLFFGLAGEIRAWFALPIFLALFSLLMLAACLEAWIRTLGSVWQRLYYTFLVLASFLALLILIKWGALTVWA